MNFSFAVTGNTVIGPTSKKIYLIQNIHLKLLIKYYKKKTFRDF